MRTLPLLVVLLSGCPAVDDPDDTGVVDTSDTGAHDTAVESDDTDTDTDTDEPPRPEVVDCEASLGDPGDDVCVVTIGRGPGLLVRGAVLAPDTVYEGGGVWLLADGSIACVGCDCADTAAREEATVVDCPDAVVSPGLINAHDHLGYGEGAPLPASSRRWDHRHEWRRALSTPRNAHGADGTRFVEARLLLGGATSVFGSSETDGLLRNLDGNLEGLDVAPAVYDTFPLGDSDGTFRADCAWRFGESEASVAAMHRYVPHVAEGIDGYAASEFVCASDGAAGEDFVEGNTSFVHAVGLGAADYARMAFDGTALVWSPRSNVSLYGMTAQVGLFRRLGGTVALGTDWTYSGSASVLRELQCADAWNSTYLDGAFTDRQLWELATAGAAHTLGVDAAVGSLVPGLEGDVAVFAREGRAPFRAVIEAGSREVALVLRGGEALYGERDVVNALRDRCDPVDVCGLSRAVCTRDEIGTTWEGLLGLVDGAYPAFFCDEPEGEPTCVPSRPGVFDGVVRAQDGDGDGIEDDSDLCPTVFDPVRPLDGGAQADADRDGVGDACDATPIGTDFDGDGVPNAVDLCPLDHDPDQSDLDRDGKGDACDLCPDVANPATGCPPATTTIGDIQDGTVATGEGVRVVGVVVTGVDKDGFSAQDPRAADARHSGVYVWTDGAPGVAVGDEVAFSGTVTEYYDMTEVSASSFEVTGTGGVTPTVVSLADAASEAYEGVLVTVTGTVSDAAYDCTRDVSACADTGLWELGGAGGLLLFERMYDDTDWSARIPANGALVTVTGVLGWRFERRRLMPRSADDL